MGQYNFVNAGSAVADSISQLMLQREAQKRQALLDSITQQREARMLSQQDEAMKLARQQFDAGQGEKLIENAGADEILSPEGEQFVKAAGGGGRIDSKTQIHTPGLGVLEQTELPVDARMPDAVNVLRPGPKFEQARVAAGERADLAKTAAVAKAELEAEKAEERKTRAAEQDALRREMGNLAAATSRGNSANTLSVRQDAAAEKKAAAEKEFKGKRDAAKAVAQEALNTMDQMYDPTDTTKTKLSPGMLGILAPGVSGFLTRAKQYSPGSPEANASALRQQLTGQQVIALINEMKSQSRTGATGFGALSGPELDLLRAAAGRLSTMQDPVQFEKALREIRAKLEKVFVDAPSSGAATTGSPDPFDMSGATTSTTPSASTAAPSRGRIVPDPANPSSFIRVP